MTEDGGKFERGRHSVIPPPALRGQVCRTPIDNVLPQRLGRMFPEQRAIPAGKPAEIPKSQSKGNLRGVSPTIEVATVDLLAAGEEFLTRGQPGKCAD